MSEEHNITSEERVPASLSEVIADLRGSGTKDTTALLIRKIIFTGFSGFALPYVLTSQRLLSRIHKEQQNYVEKI